MTKPFKYVYYGKQCAKMVHIIDTLELSSQLIVSNVIGKGSYGKVYELCKNNKCNYVLKLLDIGTDSLFAGNSADGTNLENYVKQWSKGD